jgi:hypothetical protein
MLGVSFWENSLFGRGEGGGREGVSSSSLSSSKTLMILLFLVKGLAMRRSFVLHRRVRSCLIDRESSVSASRSP